MVRHQQPGRGLAPAGANTTGWTVELLIIRHAIAEDRAAAASRGVTEFDRALTAKGAKRMKAAADGLRVLAPDIMTVAHSPLRRTRETAEIVVTRYPQAHQVTVDALRPGGEPPVLERWLASVGSDTTAVVGHEPDLGQWITRLLTGQAGDFAPLKKGGMCCLRFAAEPRPGDAVLKWMLPPRALRALR